MSVAAAATRKERDPQVRGRLATALVVGGGALSPLGWGLAASGAPKAGNLVFIAGLVMAAVGVALLGAFEQIALWRLIQDLPTSRIRSAHQGYVELRGFIRPGGGELIGCPACGHRCLWFQYYQNKGRTRVTPLGRTPDIVLDDGTGQCLINPLGVELWSARRGEGRHAHICPGDAVHVLGEFRTRATLSTTPAAAMPATRREPVSPTARQAALRAALQALKYDARRMKVFDTDKDGYVGVREWEAATQAVERQVDRELASGAVPARPEHSLAKPAEDEDRLPFFVFVGTEREAVGAARAEFGRRALMGAFFCVVVSIFVLNGGLASDGKADSRRGSAARAAQPTAHELYRDGRFGEAVAAYDASIARQPGDAELHYWRGRAHLKEQQYDAALADFRRAIELQPAHWDSHLNADWLLAQQQRWDEIVAMWDRYLRAKPDDARGYLERGGANLRRGDLAAARADVERACAMGNAEGCTHAQRLAAGS
jgi:tetratricopeptide (TPR) repeat protein